MKNNTEALDTISYNTDPYKNSFFVKSIIHLNQLEDSTVCANTVESFKAALQHRQLVSFSLPLNKIRIGIYNVHAHTDTDTD